MATRMIANRAGTLPRIHLKLTGATALATAVALLLLSRLCPGAEPARPANPAEDQTQLIALAEGQSRIIDLATPVKRVIANDPAGQIILPQSSARGEAGEPPAMKMPQGGGGGGTMVARAQLLSPRQLVITGIHVGNTQFILMDDRDRPTVYDIVVQINAAQLKALIADEAPGSKIDVRVMRDSIILSGTVPDADTAKHVEQLAKLTAPNVQNHMIVAGEQQVLLRCTVAEVNKVSLRQLGINGWIGGSNLNDLFAINQIGGINPVNIGAAGSALVGGVHPPVIPFATDQNGLNLGTTPTFSLGFPRVQMQLFFKAMRQNALLKVLAEPNLVALNGQVATFVAGGEFPVPIPQGVGGAVTIEFKEYGIRLKFQPTVIGGQMIRLKVTPEVSELDYTNAIQFSGFTIPALKKRSAESAVELASGTTIALAGLLSEQVRAQASKIPALGDVPVLGTLFSSVEYQRDISELVILVTPELVSGMNPDQVPAVPGQFVTSPNDFELFGLGMVEGEASCDTGSADEALDTASPPHYRKFSAAPHQMSLHGPWGPADSTDTIVE